MQQHPRELAGNWLEQAKRDIDAAAFLASGERYDAACFACQQGAEKALKAALIWLAGDRPRTHEIGVLIAEIAAFRPEASDALRDCEALDPYYVTTRYPDAIGGGIPGSKFFKAELELALERAMRAIAFTERVLGGP